MKNRIHLSILLLFIITFAANAGEGYKVGDKAKDFKLLNVDGKYYSLSDIPDAKGYIVIFTCNHCPFSIAYEDRIIELHRKYAQLGYPVIAINPNDSMVVPEDSYSHMITRAAEKQFPFLYLLDAEQKVFPQFGATRTPHVYVLQKEKKSTQVAYIGAIDDNSKDPSAVQVRYLENAMDAIISGKTPDPATTKAIGCSIKVKTP